MIRVETILYPTDFSSYSNQAYFHALGLAQAYRAKLTVVYVCGPDQQVRQDYWQELLESIRPNDPSISVQHVLLVGDPSTEIVRYASEKNVDVIVIGTHGCTGQDGWRMGSVAERVMRQAACSVMVVKLLNGTGTVRPDAMR